MKNTIAKLEIRCSDTLQYLADLLKRQLLKQGVAVCHEAENVLELQLDATLESDTFVLSRTAGGWLLRAPAMAELYAGAGLFLHESTYLSQGMLVTDKCGEFRLQKPVRSIYFASHFFNFYHVAPLDEIHEYIDELALWGINTLAFWYDLHHFKNNDDPEAVAFRERLAAFADYARNAGMKIFYLFVANESFDESPQELRAQVEGGKRGGWYNSQICPSAPGGLDYLKKQFEEICQTFIAGLQPDIFSFWPYDQGGCGCERCAPWGANGFLRTYEALKPIAEKYVPQAKWSLSFWYCNEEEWQAGLEKIAANPRYCDYLMEEIPVFKASAYGFPKLGFPEISMNMNPWGGYGIAPQPERFQKLWNARKHELSGGYAYSEGIFEDLHKVIFAQFYCWDSSAWETVRKYGAYYFGEDVADQFVELVKLFEGNHGLPRKSHLFTRDTKEKMDWVLQNLKPITDFAAVEDAVKLAQKIDRELTPERRQEWRWRICLLRALIDEDIRAHGGVSSAQGDDYFAELCRIYHVVSDVHTWVKPPLSYRSQR